MPSFETAARFPEPACIAFSTIELLGSERLQANSPTNAIKHPYGMACFSNRRMEYLTFTLLESRQVCLAVAGHRSASEKPLGGGLIGGLLLDRRGLIGLLARHVRHHQLAQFHELLHLLVTDL